jgi:hypothetical protein
MHGQSGGNINVIALGLTEKRIIPLAYHPVPNIA